MSRAQPWSKPQRSWWVRELRAIALGFACVIFPPLWLYFWMRWRWEYGGGPELWDETCRWWRGAPRSSQPGERHAAISRRAAIPLHIKRN